MITIDMGNLPMEAYYAILHWLEIDNIEHEELMEDSLGYIAAIRMSEEDAIIMRLKLNI